MLARGRPTETDMDVPGQFIECFRASMGRDIRRRGNEDPRHGPKLSRHERGHCKSPETERHVHALIDEIGNMIVKDQFDGEIWMAAMEVHDQGRKVPLTNTNRRLHAQASLQLGREAEEIVLDLRHLVQDLTGPGKIRLPRRRQCQLARAAVEQAGPKMALKSPNLLAHGGLSQAEFTGGR